MLREQMLLEKAMVKLLGGLFAWDEATSTFTCGDYLFALEFTDEPIPSSLKHFHDQEQDYVEVFGVEVLRVGNRLRVVAPNLTTKNIMAITRAIRSYLS